MTTEQLFEQIAREHHAMIKRIASSHEAEPHLAEDLAQDIYFAIWKELSSFRGEASLRTFVARIATNRAVTHVARAVKLPQSLELSEHLPAPGETPEGHMIALDQRSRLAEAVRSLPLAYRQTALLALEGLTPKEIADVLDACIGAAVLGLAGTAIRTYLSRPPRMSPVVDLAVLAMLALRLFLCGRHVTVTVEKLRALKHALGMDEERK